MGSCTHTAGSSRSTSRPLAEGRSRIARPDRYRRFRPKANSKTLVVARTTTVMDWINDRKGCKAAWWSAHTRHAPMRQGDRGASIACSAMRLPRWRELLRPGLLETGRTEGVFLAYRSEVAIAFQPAAAYLRSASRLS